MRFWVDMHFTQSTVVILGFPGGSDGKESACNAGDSGLTPRSGRSPGERNGYPFLPGESHGQKSLVSPSPLSCKESDVSERQSEFWPAQYFFPHTETLTKGQGPFQSRESRKLSSRKNNLYQAWKIPVFPF